MAVMRGRAENDGYNALVLTAGLQWRDVALMRTISRFLRQVRVAYSQDYMWATLRKHSGIAAHIVRAVPPALRSAPRDLEGRARRAAGRARRRDRDRARRGGEPRRGPHPAPLRQCRDVGAAHQLLSARRRRPAEGDDRDQVRQPQDRRPAAAEAALRDLRLFAARRGRAPALRQGGARRHPLVGPAAGLPHRGARPRQGAAGEERRDRAGRRQGRLRAEAAAGRPRDAVQAEGTAAYKIFISSLLDVTDNLGPDGVVHPENVVRHDDDDPYLVVAADKGTATFSDTANGISLEHGFWLGDAFACGGSAGYDHKKMGITARGRVGSGEAPLPRDGRRHRRDAVHRRGRRRHVGRRVRQRHAARAHHQAGRGVRPPRHLHRSQSRSGAQLRASASACSSSRARAGRTTTRTTSRPAAASIRAAPRRSR